MFKRVSSKFYSNKGAKTDIAFKEATTKEETETDSYGQFVDIENNCSPRKEAKPPEIQITTSSTNLSDNINDKEIASFEEAINLTNVPSDIETKSENGSEISSLTPSIQSDSDMSWASKISKEKNTTSLQFDIEL